MPLKLNQSESGNLLLNQYLLDLYENPATEDEYYALESNLFDQENDYANGLTQDVLVLVVAKPFNESNLVRLRSKHLRISIDMIDNLLAIVPTALLIVNPNLSPQQTFMLDSFSHSHRPEAMLTLLKRTDILHELRTANVIINYDTIIRGNFDLKQSTPLISDIIDDNDLLRQIRIPVATWSKLINLPADTHMVMSTTAQHQTYLQERTQNKYGIMTAVKSIKIL